jgi:peptide/nickel transport system permease protein
MPERHALPQVITNTPPKVNEFRRFIRVMFSRWLVIFGFIIILITIIAAIFAPLVAPYDPNLPDMKNALQGPSLKHLLGTDELGRDTLSRIIYGTRTSLLIGITAIFLAATTGMVLGLIAGYFGGFTYMFIMRFIDALMAFPMILLALVIAAFLGGGLTNIVIAIGFSMTAVYCRLMCGQVLTIRENDYIKAERALGASDLRIMFFHVLPNTLPTLIVMVTLQMGGAILAEAGLSFLGVGLAPPNAAWGAMVNDGYRYLLTLPMLSFAPGLAIMLVVFSFNMVGDGLRDALDPRLRGMI